MLTKIDKDKLWVNPDCGLKTRGVPETEASLKNMVKAAEIIRQSCSVGLLCGWPTKGDVKADIALNYIQFPTKEPYTPL